MALGSLLNINHHHKSFASRIHTHTYKYIIYNIIWLYAQQKTLYTYVCTTYIVFSPTTLLMHQLISLEETCTPSIEKERCWRFHKLQLSLSCKIKSFFLFVALYHSLTPFYTFFFFFFFFFFLLISTLEVKLKWKRTLALKITVSLSLSFLLIEFSPKLRCNMVCILNERFYAADTDTYTLVHCIRNRKQIQ